MKSREELALISQFIATNAAYHLETRMKKLICSSVIALCISQGLGKAGRDRPQWF